MATGPDLSHKAVFDLDVSEISERYRILLDDSPLAVALHGNGRFLYLNRAAVSFLGYDRAEELVGTPVLNIAHPDSVDFFADRVQSLALGELDELPPAEEKFVRRDGVVAECEISARRSGTRVPSVIAVVIRDISEQKRISRLLKQTEERFWKLAESVRDVIFRYRIRPDIKLEYISPSFRDLSGYTPEEAYSDDRLWLKLLHPDDRHLVRRCVRELQSLQSSLALRWIKKDGTIIPVEAKNVSVRNEADGVLVIEGVVREIASINTYNTYDEKLRLVMKDNEALLREVHHRVKNNLQVIMSLLSLESKHAFDRRDKVLFEHVQGRIRSMALVHEAMYDQESISRVDFQRYIRRLVGSYRAGSGTELIDVSCECEPMQLPLDVAVPFGLVVNELLANAYQREFHSGRRGRVQIQVRQAGEIVETTVRDNGVSVSSSFKNQLVSVLVQQLNGLLRVRQHRGNSITVEFPLEIY